VGGEEGSSAVVVPSSKVPSSKVKPLIVRFWITCRRD
jgi:hypothetical protein